LESLVGCVFDAYLRGGGRGRHDAPQSVVVTWTVVGRIVHAQCHWHIKQLLHALPLCPVTSRTSSETVLSSFINSYRIKSAVTDGGVVHCAIQYNAPASRFCLLLLYIAPVGSFIGADRDHSLHRDCYSPPAHPRYYHDLKVFESRWSCLQSPHTPDSDITRRGADRGKCALAATRGPPKPRNADFPREMRVGD
jgi:hypothetical protein